MMDEPTAALNDAEVPAALHDLIRRIKCGGTRSSYISHRMDEQGHQRRITAVRDGHYVANLETATTTMKEVISLIAGPGAGQRHEAAEAPRGRGRDALGARTVHKDLYGTFFGGGMIGSAIKHSRLDEAAQAAARADRASLSCKPTSPTSAAWTLLPRIQRPTA